MASLVCLIEIDMREGIADPIVVNAIPTYDCPS